MPKDNVRDRNLASFVEITDALLKGDFHHDLLLVDAEGLLSNLAQKINAMMINMKTVEKPLSSAGEQAPFTVSRAEVVIELMSQSTNDVLNKADLLINGLNEIETSLSVDGDTRVEAVKKLQEQLPSMKSLLFDIIASQSYQDAARQKMEKLIAELTNIRDWLINVLLVLNIKYDTSKENVKMKTNLLREVKENESEDMKQDLIDDLLAEFGF
jgi:chemotaxis regulatin CheY-phosphate phosphatase CheZ